MIDKMFPAKIFLGVFIIPSINSNTSKDSTEVHFEIKEVF